MDYPLEITFSEPVTMTKKQKVELIHLLSTKYREVASVVRQLQNRVKTLEADAEIPLPMILACPVCGERHIDIGKFANHPHHTHACQECGIVWRPAVKATVGVHFLPGFKDDV